MIANENIKPNELLRNTLKIKGITQKKFAKIIDIPYPSFNKYVIGTKKFDAKIALILEKTLDIPAEEWLIIQIKQDILNERLKPKIIRKLAGIPPANILYMAAQSNKND